MANMRDGANQRRVRLDTTPLNIPRTLRGHELRTLTSLPAGKMVPIAVSPVLREDAVQRGRMRLTFEMHETAEVLLNAVNVNVLAYLVPWLAMDRFNSLEEFNLSYEGETYPGLSPVNFFETHVKGAHEDEEIYTYLGIHASPGDNVNSMYREAYNQIWNFRATNRSPDIAPRLITDETLAPAFWVHERFGHIVPDFDQAKIDGEVALNIVDGKMHVKGIGFDTSHTSGQTNIAIRESGQSPTTRNFAKAAQSSTASNNIYVEEDPDNAGWPLVFAEMQANGITVSLANIELARKAQAFAQLREQYSGHSDEWIIDLLMDGISLPEQAWKQPILIGSGETIFGQNKRYATDAANLAESAVNGATFVDLAVRTPVVPTGGVLMVVAEITPEQLFERQQDPFFALSSVDDLPQYLRDELDPEKVEVVSNNFVDTDHGQPTDTFGYGPLNFKWNYKSPRIGGRYYRPEVDAPTDDDRQRIWAVETQDPALATDFYVATNMHSKPFLDTVADPFECVLQGQLVISGHTVFGHQLIEASDDYAEVMEEAPQERIDKTA